MSRVKTAIYLLVFALISPYLYNRYNLLAEMHSNRPGKLQRVYNIKSHHIRFRDQLKNCEDIVLDEEKGLAFISCSPGRDRWNTVMGTFAQEKGLTPGQLWLLDYGNKYLSDTEALKPLKLTGFEGADQMQPLGIEYDHTSLTLYVINHAPTGSVLEIFSITTSTATATHIRTLKHPFLHAPNSIHSLGNGKLFVSNDHFFPARNFRLLSKLETFSGLPGGTLVFIDVHDLSIARIVARVPFANGITMVNESVLAVVSTSLSGIYLFDVTPSFSLQNRRTIHTPPGIDNISVDRDGKLLVAGHPWGFGLIRLAAQRAQCDLESDSEDERNACECWAPSWVAEWDGSGGGKGMLRELYKGFEYCSSTTMVRDRKRGVAIVSALYDRGLMFMEE